MLTAKKQQPAAPATPAAPSASIPQVEGRPTLSPSPTSHFHDTATVLDGAGLICHHRFAPNDHVWTLDSDRRVAHTTVIRIDTQHRSLVSTGCHLSTRITYVLANGLTRRDDEVFATLDDLTVSLIRQAEI